MEKFKLFAYYFALLILCHFTFSLATDYQQNETRDQISFFMWIIDTINLFIHEGGHFVFGSFGRFIHFIGGSLMQVLIPIATIIVFARTSLYSIPFTFYWAGHSLVNVSIYIGDAPYLKLRLISRSAIHDWNWIMNYLGIMEYSEAIAGIVNVLGILICCVGIGFGFYFGVKNFPKINVDKNTFIG